MPTTRSNTFDDQPPDYAQISNRWLGTPAFEKRISARVQYVQELMGKEASVGNIARAQQKSCKDLATKLHAAAEAMSQVRLNILLDAFGVPKVEGSGPNLPLYTAYEGVHALRRNLYEMSSQLTVRFHRKHSRKPGRPPISHLIDFALEGLLSLWREAGQHPPNLDEKEHPFFQFAKSILVEPPLAFAERSVQRRLRSFPGLRIRRPTEPEAKRPKRTRFEQDFRTLVIGSSGELGQELAREYAKRGSHVIFATPSWPSRHSPIHREDLGKNVKTSKFIWNARESFNAGKNAGPVDLIIFADYDPEHNYLARNALEFDPLKEERDLGRSLIPLHELLRGASGHWPYREEGELDGVPRKGPPMMRPRIVVLTAPTLPVSMHPDWQGLSLHLRESARLRLVSTWNQAIRDQDGLAFAIKPAWGRTMAGPLTHASPRETAQELVELIPTLGWEYGGRLIDLRRELRSG